MERVITKEQFREICAEKSADLAMEFAKDGGMGTELALLSTLLAARYTAKIMKELFNETEEIIIVEKE